jgi:hypothetical protein
MVTLDWGGTQHTVYTNDNGDYAIDMSNDSTFFVGSAVNGYLRVTLQDQGYGDADEPKPYIEVYENGDANPIFAKTVNFNISTANDLVQNVDLSLNANIHNAALPIDRLDDAAIIYFHTYQALDFALNTLGLSLDCELPVEVFAWNDDGTFYWSVVSEITIGIDGQSNNSDFDNGNRPDNREWHEFSHFIMEDSTIAGDNALPLLHTGGFPSWPQPPTSEDTNHGGYGNHCTSDSWTEGFAECISCLIAEETGDPNPSWYAIDDNERAVEIETNWRAWDFRGEEYAVAGLLWDLQDGINGADSDWIDLTVTEHWNLLNNADHQNVHDIYVTLNNSDLAQLTGNGDPEQDEIDNLDELFIAHGHFGDRNGNYEYDDDEAVGFTGKLTKSEREATPEIPGSYIMVNVIDSSTLTQVDVSEFDVEMRVEPPHDYLNANFTIGNRNQSLYFMMPPPHYSAKAYIYAKKNGYQDSTPLVIDNSFYWERIREPGLEYLTEHTFYLKPDGIEVFFVTLASPSPSDTTEILPASISSVSKGQDYYIEIWASDVGGTNTGLTSVYVDMHFDPCGVATVQEIDHGGIFTLSRSGTIGPGGIDELGGSCKVGVGIEPEWARVAVVKMRAEAYGTVCCSLSPSDAGIATLERGLIPWSEIILSGDTCCFPSAHSAFSDWFALGKPDCWCANVNPRQCHGDADSKSQGKKQYWVSTDDLDVLIAAWSKSFAEIEGRDFNGTPLICADFDHKAAGKKKYRVSSDDLDILIANWSQANAPAPNCP